MRRRRRRMQQGNLQARSRVVGGGCDELGGVSGVSFFSMFLYHSAILKVLLCIERRQEDVSSMNCTVHRYQELVVEKNQRPMHAVNAT